LFLWVKATGAYGYNLSTFMYRLSSNLGASASWNHQELFKPEWESLTFTISVVEIRLETVGETAAVNKLQKKFVTCAECPSCRIEMTRKLRIFL
jgi:hypothetical protein